MPAAMCYFDVEIGPSRCAVCFDVETDHCCVCPAGALVPAGPAPVVLMMDKIRRDVEAIEEKFMACANPEETALLVAAAAQKMMDNEGLVGPAYAFAHLATYKPTRRWW